MLGRLAIVAVISAPLVLWVASLGTPTRGASQFGTPAAADGAETSATLAAILRAPEVAHTVGPQVVVTVGPETVATLTAMLSAAEVALTAQAALSVAETAEAALAAAQTAEAVLSPTPEPAACDEADIQPRSVSEIASFVDQTGEAAATPVGTPRPASITVPVGEPADAETATAVEDTLRREAACFNEDKVLHAFAYSTDERFHRDPALISMPDRIELIEVDFVTNVSVLPDGRVGALCVFTLQPGGQTTKYCMFALHDARWLIDETIPLGGP